MSRLLLQRGAVGAPESAAPAFVYERFADLEGVSHLAADQFDTEGEGGIVTGSVGLTSSDAYTGTQCVQCDAPITGTDQNSIARLHWFNPGNYVDGGATPGEQLPMAEEDEELWAGCAIKLRSSDTHHFNRILGFNMETDLLIEFLYRGPVTGAELHLNNYSTGTSSVPSIAPYFSGIEIPLDVWFYLEIGMLISQDAEVGWIEVWIDDVLQEHADNYTIKDNGIFTRIQMGFGNKGEETPAARMLVDDAYWGHMRRPT